MRSWAARTLAVRRVTQDNQGKKTAGVDGKTARTTPERVQLVEELQPKNRKRRKHLPVRRGFKHRGGVGSRHSCFGHMWLGRSHSDELHGSSNRPQALIGFEGRPLAQKRRVGERLPDFLRRVAQFSDEDERLLISVLLYLCPAGRTRRVLLAIGHLSSPFVVGVSAHHPRSFKRPITSCSCQTCCIAGSVRSG